MDSDDLKRAALWIGIIVILLTGHYPRLVHNLITLGALVVWIWLVNSTFPGPGPYQPSRLEIWAAKIKRVVPVWLWVCILLALLLWATFASSFPETPTGAIDEIQELQEIQR